MQHFSTVEEEGANCLMPPEILAFLKIVCSLVISIMRSM